MTSTYVTTDGTETSQNKIIISHHCDLLSFNNQWKKEKKKKLTCVSPRENSADPCNMDIYPASQYKGLTSSSCLPSSLYPSVIILLRTTYNV